MKQKISITVDENVLTKIQELAQINGRPVSQYINLLLKRHIESYELRRSNAQRRAEKQSMT